MRVAIDAHMVGRQETGNETYIFNLVQALTRLDAENWYALYTTAPQNLRTRLQLPANFQVIAIRPAWPILRIPFAMPYTAWRQAADMLHVTYNAPPLCPCPTVVTVHDISFRLYPEWFSPRDRIILSTLVPLSIRRAARVLTISEHSKRDLVREYGIAPDKIVVTPLAAAEHYRPQQDPAHLAAIREQYGLAERFVLAVGNLQPRKNLHRLLEAYRRLAAQDELPQLAIVGKSHWQGSHIVQLVADYGLENRVKFTGYVPETDLPRLYNAALCLVFPSLYEGFGLPVLEAMACGTPVLASSASAVSEVAQDAAIVFDPRNVDEIAQALHDVLNDESLRQRLSRKGQERARLFSWERTARLTLDTYREILSHSKGTR